MRKLLHDKDLKATVAFMKAYAEALFSSARRYVHWTAGLSQDTPYFF